MSDIFPAIEAFLQTARNLGLVEHYALSYGGDQPACTSYDSRIALKQLIERLKSSLEQITARTDIPMLEENLNIDAMDMKDATEMEPYIDDENLVQVRVSRNEMNRRISAFINRKRTEINERNAEEFCRNVLPKDGDPDTGEDEKNSCARVDAVFVPRCGTKSHIKVSRVENRFGPQLTLSTLQEQIDHKPAILSATESSFEDIDERLRNMESHLKIKTENNIKKNLYGRLKILEDKILFLEGLSPEYFHMRTTSSRFAQGRFRIDTPYQDCSISELQGRMKQLKEHLMIKSCNIDNN